MEDTSQSNLSHTPPNAISQQDFEAMRQRYAEELLAIRRSVDAMLGRTSPQPSPAEFEEPAVPAAVFPAEPPPISEQPPEERTEEPSVQQEDAVPPPDAGPTFPETPMEDEEIQNLNEDVLPEDEEALAPHGAKPAPLTDEATLQVLVTAAQQAIPIPNVLVLLSRQDPGQPLETLIRVMSTDESGQTPVVVLPAPDRALTQEPGEYLPYTVYRVVVAAEGYQPQFHGNVALFGGMSTLLPVELIPLLEAPVPPPSRVGENYTSL